MEGNAELGTIGAQLESEATPQKRGKKSGKSGKGTKGNKNKSPKKGQKMAGQ